MSYEEVQEFNIPMIALNNCIIRLTTNTSIGKYQYYPIIQAVALTAYEKLDLNSSSSEFTNMLIDICAQDSLFPKNLFNQLYRLGHNQINNYQHGVISYMEIRLTYRLAIRLLQKDLISFESSLELLNNLYGICFCNIPANIIPLEVVNG